MAGNRITQNLESRKLQGHGALLPYFTAGFPGGDVTQRLVMEADRVGASCVEIGFPFSDSLADGPVIQESFHRVLSNGWSVSRAWDLVADVRSNVSCGLIAMVSFSIVHRHGVDTFFKQAAHAGFDGVILPDVPTEETQSVKGAVEDAGLAYIGLIAPRTSPDRSDSIMRDCSGFVYRIASSGTTGERAQLPEGLTEDVEQMRQQSGLPVCVGFGVSSANHVREVCRAADGAIVGSAIVRRIADAVDAGQSEDAIVAETSTFLQELQAGTEDARA